MPSVEVPPRARGSGLRKIFLPFFFSFFFLYSLRTREKQKQAGVSTPRRATLRGCINIMQISGATLLQVTSRSRGRARPLHVPAVRPREILTVAAKCRCLFPPRYARLACLPYRPEIACTLHTRHNSTPNLLQLPPLPLRAATLVFVFLSAVLSYRILSLLLPLSVPYSGDASYIAPIATSPCDLFSLTTTLRRRFCAVRSTVERAPSFETWKRAEKERDRKRASGKASFTLTDTRVRVDLLFCML